MWSSKVLFILIISAFALLQIRALNLGCPASSSIVSCSPKCKSDSDCTSGARKCCPNICNQNSCLPDNHSASSSDGYKNKNKGSSTGSYCGNVKCNSYEKCELDRSTKREKCVRH